MKKGPVIIGKFTEKINAVKAQSSRRSSNAAYPAMPVRGQILLPDQAGSTRSDTDPQLEVEGIPDNNRSIIFPNFTAEIEGRGYALSIKGIGARTPLYGSSPIDSFSSGNTLPAREVTDELWFGEAPYGAQGEVSADFGLKLTGLAEGCNINGFYICPVIEINEFPGHITDNAVKFWYRRYHGKYMQEQRLVPSNIRLYHQSKMTLGQTTAGVLSAFEINAVEELDTFINNYISSGIAALTLFARTLRKGKYGYEGLDYVNVWLDKDSVIAPDGTIHFVDIEGLDWLTAGCEVSLEKRIRFQFDRNYYEFMYGLDALLRQRCFMAHTDMGSSIEDIRGTLAVRFEMSLNKDPFIECDNSGDSVDIVIFSRVSEADHVIVRLMDLR